MAYKLCPLSCISKSKSKQNCIVSTDADVQSVEWDALCPMVFCSDVFPPNSIRNETSTDMSNTCWYCHVDSTTSGKFVTKKSTDPIPEEIRLVQEKLDFMPGEPLTKHSFHKIIPKGSHKSEWNNTYESSRQAEETTPLQTASPNDPPSLKRKCEERGYHPFKKYAGDRFGSSVLKANSQHRAFEYKSMKSSLGFNSKGLATV